MLVCYLVGYMFSWVSYVLKIITILVIRNLTVFEVVDNVVLGGWGE